MKSTIRAVIYIWCWSSALAADSPLVEPTSKDNSPQCDCYLTSGPDPGYFQYHRFWDFRNVPNDDQDDYTVAPPLVTASQNDGDEPITSSYFNTTQFLADWTIQTGLQGGQKIIPNYNSAQNIYISRNSTAKVANSTYLTLRANRLSSFASIAELDSNQKNLLHCSIRVRARVIPNGLSNSSAPSAGTTALNNLAGGSNASHPVNAGAVWGFFTYHNDQQESDIEILTYDSTSQIHYSNQPDYDATTDNPIPDASTQDTLPQNAVWTDWLDHRIDWFQGVSRWYVNDQLVQNKTKNVPTDHSGLIINLWSDGGTWSGNMSVGSQVTVGIEWIDMVFNVSGNVDGSGNHKRNENVAFWKRKTDNCKIGCNVDGVRAVGYPEVAYNVSSAAVSQVQLGNNIVSLLFGVTMLSVLFLQLA